MSSSKITKWVDQNREIFFDLVRIYLGIGLFIKGIYFIGHRDFLLATLTESGAMWFAPAGIAHYVIMAHIAGGFCMAIGLLTRAAALIQIPVLVGAVFYVHLPKMVNLEPRQYSEFSALVLFLLILIFIRGAGPLSVDARLESQKSQVKSQR